MRYAPEWSPDGKRLAFSDNEGKLYVLSVQTRELREVADHRGLRRFGYTWSPRGGHLAFTMRDPSQFRSVYIWSVDGGELRRITGEYFNEFEVAWDPEGNYLFYLGNREYAPQLGSLERNYLVDRETHIYALALREDILHPFPPKSDEVTIQEEGKEREGEGEEDGAGDEYVRIDFDGLAERVARVPVEAGNYMGLSANKGHILYVRSSASYWGRSSDRPPSLMIFSMEDREATELAEGISEYAPSPDGSKVLVRQGSNYNLLDASPSVEGSSKAVSTAGLQVERVPKEEWVQIFDEVWRRFRDFFYVPNMHGYNWEALRNQYRPLLEHVAHRSDLNYVIGEMISELNVSHTYVSGGDFVIPERPRVALPGARFELDRRSGRYRIAHILRGQNEEDRYRSPLTEIGVQVNEGDYVLAIDGEELTGSENPYRLLRHKAERPVRLTVNDRPTINGAREVTFSPITSERSLLYLEWVNENRERVAEMTDGRVGYLHIPDMGATGTQEFIKWFYPQIRKEGLIVDVRWNGGGRASQMLIERLRRELLATWFRRGSESPGTYPQTVFHGHMVCLLNERSGSDGDIFPAMFRQAGLGPLIGKRSWGGVVGGGTNPGGPFIDGGSVFVPRSHFTSTEGEWILEGYGVVPDIEVENSPKAVLEGRDPQLERAIEEVMRRVREDPRRLPTRPAAPVKTEQPRTGQTK